MFDFGQANSEQIKAIQHTEGPVLIIAGPGTGKTFTLVKRVVYLISEKKVGPENILIATFTEKAAKELVTRISNELIKLEITVNVNELYIGTLHSICLRLIKENVEFTRLKKNYRLMDDFDQKYLIYRNHRSFDEIENIELISDTVKPWERAKQLSYYFNAVSEELVTSEDLKKDPDPAVQVLAKAYEIYQSLLAEENAMDFSSIQVIAYNLLKENGSVRQKVQEQLRYVMIDEYQDTNYVQEYDVWNMPFINPVSNERLDYPTQKPETILERIISVCTNPGDIVFDCFMGSGTTQAVAMKLGRRFIGADINLGAIQTTTKRLINVARDLNAQIDAGDKYTGFEVYNVNNYDLFRNPVEARDLILQALEVQPFETSNVYDGEKDGRMIKLMPVNRIATKADLQGLIANFPYKSFEKRKEEDPSAVVLKLTLVCMGHEPDLAVALKQELSAYKVDIDVVDILHDRTDLQFKRDSEADISVENGELIIKNFYPLNLMQKLSLDKKTVAEWRQLVESVMIDFNFDGAVMQPSCIDIPEKNGMVKGRYKIPESAGIIRVKITDVLSESLEVEVQNG